MVVTKMVQSESGSGTRPPRNEGWYTERPFVASGVALLFVIILGGFLLVHGAGNSHSTSGTTTPSTAPAAALATSEVPTSAPKGTTWSLWYGIALPSLPDSPARVDNDVPDGFAHTPDGALIAASQLTYRMIFGPKWQAVAEKYATGPNRDTYIARELSAPGDHSDTSGVAQLAGFRFLSYSPDQAVVEQVVGNTSYRSSTITLLWINDDWRLLIAPGDDVAPDPVTVANLNGYAPWTGVAR